MFTPVNSDEELPPPAAYTEDREARLGDKIKSVPAVERVLSILEMLASSQRGLTPSQIARNLQLARSSAHYLLVTLERRGYLHRGGERGRYVFTPKLFELANSTLSRLPIRELARPALRTLLEESGLTVHMAIVDQNEAVIVDKAEPPHLHLPTWIGKRMPLHCTGTGKALMAFLPTQAVDRVVACGLIRYNENTIVSARRLREEMAAIRKVGYALDDEEETMGLRCIGAPILDASYQAIAAISVAGTIQEITPEKLSHLASLVRRAAERVSNEVARTTVTNENEIG